MRSHKRGVTAGPKLSNTHTSYVSTAEKVILLAKALPEVSKVVLSKISPAKNGRASVKCVPILAGLRVQVRAPRAVQVLFVYTNDPDGVAAKLSSLF